MDTSALVKVYIEEEGTSKVLELMSDTENVRAVILDLALVEARSAIRRREREGDVSAAVADQILFRMEADASASFLVQPSTTAVIEEASRRIERYPLRAYDAMQRAGCEVVRDRLPEAPRFVCSDTRLCEVANSEGLAVLNPTSR